VLAAGALIGVTAALGGAFIFLDPKVKSALVTLNAWGISTKAAAISTGIVAGVIAAAAIAFVIWGTAQANAKARIDTFKDSLDKETGAITTNTRAVAFNNLQQDGMIDKAKRAGVNLDDLVTASIDPTSDAYKRLETQLNTASDALSKVANAKPGSGAGPGPDALSNWSDMVDVLKSVGIQQGAVTDAQSKLRDEQSAAIDTTGALGSATDMTTAALQAQADAAKALSDAYAKWITDTANIDASFVSLGGGYDTLVQKNKDAATATADSTTSSKDSWQTYYDGFTVSVDGYLAELQRQVDAQGAWETNMLLLSGRVSQGTLDELAKLGPQGAPLVAQLTTASDAELTKLDAVFAQKAQTATTNFATTLSASAPLIAWAAATLGQGAADEIAGKLGAGTATVASIMAQYGVTISSIHPNVVVTIAANDAAARATFAKLLHDMGGTGALAGVPFTFHNATGNILDFMAAGGLTPMSAVAQMVPANSWRVVGDRTDVSEAFIPLDGSARSLAILDEAARRLGRVAIPAGASMQGAGSITTSSAPSPAPSLAGLAIVGTLDLGGGLIGMMHGVVQSELASAQKSRTSAIARGSR
jgi:hypothetical protein